MSCTCMPTACLEGEVLRLMSPLLQVWARKRAAVYHLGPCKLLPTAGLGALGGLPHTVNCYPPVCDAASPAFSSCCLLLLKRALVPRRAAPSTTKTRMRRGALSRCMRPLSRGWARRLRGRLLVWTCCMCSEQEESACSGCWLHLLHGACQVETAPLSLLAHSLSCTQPSPLTLLRLLATPAAWWQNQ